MQTTNNTTIVHHNAPLQYHSTIKQYNTSIPHPKACLLVVSKIPTAILYHNTLFKSKYSPEHHTSPCYPNVHHIPCPQSNLSYDHIAPLSLPHTARYIQTNTRTSKSVQYLTGTPCPYLVRQSAPCPPDVSGPVVTGPDPRAVTVSLSSSACWAATPAKETTSALGRWAGVQVNR